MFQTLLFFNLYYYIYLRNISQLEETLHDPPSGIVRYVSFGRPANIVLKY